jgi:hypothetical protein
MATSCERLRAATSICCFTTDRRISYQQNLSGRRIAIVVSNPYDEMVATFGTHSRGGWCGDRIQLYRGVYPLQTTPADIQEGYHLTPSPALHYTC